LIPRVARPVARLGPRGPRAQQQEYSAGAAGIGCCCPGWAVTLNATDAGARHHLLPGSSRAKSWAGRCGYAPDSPADGGFRSSLRSRPTWPDATLLRRRLHYPIQAPPQGWSLDHHESDPGKPRGGDQKGPTPASGLFASVERIPSVFAQVTCFRLRDRRASLGFPDPFGSWRPKRGGDLRARSRG